MSKNKINNVGYKIVTPILGFLFKLYYNPKIVGKENIPSDGPIILACNHKHVFDQCPICISTKRVLHWMAKKEYFDGKTAWFFKLSGCIPVDRGSSEDTSKEVALGILEKGGAIGLFPEGTRNKTYTEVMLPLKFGVVSMSSKTGAYIVPCAVTGDYKFRSKNLMVRFGTPFKVGDMDYVKANEILRESIIDLMEENLKSTNRSMEEELNSRNQDQKKK